MNFKQLARMRNDDGFIAALDQSDRGLMERVLTSAAFTRDKVLAAIITPEMMDSTVSGMRTADYLWGVKGIVPVIQADAGLADEKNGVRLMKPNPGLWDLVSRAKEMNVFGTRMRSQILWPDEAGIHAAVEQQFTLASRVIEMDMVPIIGLEVGIGSREKTLCEEILVKELTETLDGLSDTDCLMLELTLPNTPGLYAGLTDYSCVVRAAALSGGYSIEEANKRLASNKGVVACYSRALTERLRSDQTDFEFAVTLADAISEIYEASII